jgi:malonyl-CoA O-methyltransferase
MAASGQLDKGEVRRAFDRAADTYDAHAVLQAEVARRLMERLDLVRLEPKTLLDVGCGTGTGTRKLVQRYPKASCIALDLSFSMLARARNGPPFWKRLLAFNKNPTMDFVCGDMESLPLKKSSIDFVWSSLALQWANRLEITLAEFHRVLRPGGLVLFATFGPDTLKELRAAFATIDDRPHVSRFVDMHDIGDMLMQAGFQNPVMEMEQMTLTYDTLRSLMQDLKRIGAHNADSGRPRGLLGREAWHRLESAYEQFRHDGRLPASYELVYGHAWVGSKDRLPDGSQVIRLDRSGRENFRERK